MTPSLLHGLEPVRQRYANIATARVELLLKHAQARLDLKPGDEELTLRVAALQSIVDERGYQSPRLGSAKSHRSPPRPFLRWQSIIDDVCRRHRVTRQYLFSGYKDEIVVAARHELWWTIRTRFSVSYPQIGARLGGYDHSSIYYGVRAWQRRLDAQQQRQAA